MIRKQLFFLIVIVFSINAFGQSKQLADKEKDKLYPTKEITSRYHNDWTRGHYKKRIKHFKNEPLEFGDIVFIGNSITEQGGSWTDRFNIDHIRNRGIAGDVSDGVLKRLNEIVYFKPKAVFILIGVNDLSNIHHEEAKRKFQYDKIVPSTDYVGKNILKIAKIIHHKSPDTKIFVRTVLPTRRGYLKADIISVNKVIKKNEDKGFYQVVDLYSQFVDSNGDLQKCLTTDGVHLNSKGYEKWVRIEEKLVKEL